MELIERIAALVPPARMHRHGLAGTVPDVPGARAVAIDDPARTSCPGVHHTAFAPTWPQCGTEMPIVAFITEASTVQRILDHIDEPTAPPGITPARGPPLWEEEDSGTLFLDEDCFTGGPLAQPEPQCQFDQRVNW